MLNELKQKIKKMVLSSKISIGIAIAGFILSSLSLYNSCNANKLSSKSNDLAKEANQIAKEVFEVQNTPRLSAQILGESYVGPMEGRIDEVVTIPIIVFNNSDTFAHKVTLDLLISDGTGRVVSLNDYFKSINAPIMYMERIIPRGQWPIIPAKAIPAPGNSKLLYSTGQLKFKAKLQLKWEDVKRREYKFVYLAELKYVHIKDEKEIEAFVFEPKGSYSSIDNKNALEKFWGLDKFDF